MSGIDALQSIRDAITHLEEATAPVEDQIQEVRDEAGARVAELEAQIAEQRDELVRWRRALVRAEGKAAQGDPDPNGRRAGGSLAISDEALTAALEGRPDGLSASEIRAALDVNADVSSSKVTRLLGDAVSRGVVKRVGERRGTRYLTS